MEKKELEVAKKIELLNQRELACKVGSTTRWCETVADCSTPHILFTYQCYSGRFSG